MFTLSKLNIPEQETLAAQRSSAIKRSSSRRGVIIAGISGVFILLLALIAFAVFYPQDIKVGASSSPVLSSNPVVSEDEPKIGDAPVTFDHNGVCNIPGCEVIHYWKEEQGPRTVLNMIKATSLRTRIIAGVVFGLIILTAIAVTVTAVMLSRPEVVDPGTSDIITIDDPVNESTDEHQMEEAIAGIPKAAFIAIFTVLGVVVLVAVAVIGYKCWLKRTPKNYVPDPEIDPNAITFLKGYIDANIVKLKFEKCAELHNLPYVPKRDIDQLEVARTEIPTNLEPVTIPTINMGKCTLLQLNVAYLAEQYNIFLELKKENEHVNNFHVSLLISATRSNPGYDDYNDKLSMDEWKSKEMKLVSLFGDSLDRLKHFQAERCSKLLYDLVNLEITKYDEY